MPRYVYKEPIADLKAQPCVSKKEVIVLVTSTVLFLSLLLCILREMI